MSTAAFDANPFHTPFTTAWMSRERIETMGWMTAGMVGTAAVAGGLWTLVIPGLEVAVDPVVRLGHTLALASGASAVLLAQLMGLFRMFDTEHAMNPLQGGETERYRITNRSLGNTVEQALMFLPPLVALGALSDAATWPIVPMLAGTWIIGRLVFWAGYQIRMASRGMGMVMTLNATFATFAALAYVLFV